MNFTIFRMLICAALLLLRLERVAAESWSLQSPLNSPRHSHTATLLSDGQVLIAGGVSTQDAITNSAEIFNPSTGVATLTGSMSTGRWEHVAVLLQTGQVLVTGGFGRQGSLASAELYTPSAGQWVSTAPMTTVRAHHTATLLLDGKVLITGGTDLTGNATNACEL